MVATPVLTRAVVGLQAHPVTVECHIAAGLPRTTIVGLAEGAVKESRDRINSALRTCGFHFPRGHVIVNLAPSHLTKSGSSYDLPIALAILCASDQIEIREAATTEFVGELGLFGEIRRINGLLSCALACQKAHHALYLPKANELEASLIKQGKLRIAGHLLELCAHLNGKPQSAVQAPKSEPVARHRQRQSTYEQILGQSAAKRASLIAAAGSHHLLMVGPPGTGKTLLAKAWLNCCHHLQTNKCSKWRQCTQQLAYLGQTTMTPRLENLITPQPTRRCWVEARHLHRARVHWRTMAYCF